MKRFAVHLCATILALTMLLGVLAPALAADDSTYRTLYSGEITSLNYLITSTTNEFAVAANIIDTLVEYDNYGQIQPSLAESWETGEDGLTWTFHLRNDVQWVRADGSFYANVTANDFVFAAKYILDAQNASTTADLLYGVIDGAEAYYDGTATPEAGKEAAPKKEWDTVGVKALDDYTLQYTLNRPVPYFLSMTTYVCFMPANEQFVTEKGADFGLATANDTVLYCGAYILSEFKPQETRVYTRNESYWDKDKVFITKIQQTYNKEASNIGAELYLRGEIDAVDLSSAVTAEWLKDPQKAELIHPVRRTSFYTYFYAFNFDPKFDAAYEPDNWKLAVNNENFRQSIYAGFDRVKAMLITDPDNAEALIYNTITPPDFVTLDGIDYVKTGALKAITEKGAATFDQAAALAYKQKAVEELKTAGATFPVKMLMYYNPSSSGWAEECQIVEQQLEGLLGNDYIDIIIEAGPTSGFLNATRRSGNYAFMKVNWGPDYADPETFTDPFAVGNNYNFMDLCVGYEEADGTKTYNKLANDAIAMTGDLAARYNAFADAEAFLINHALVIPFGTGTGGYTASRLDPFTAQFAPFGLSVERYKGQKLLEKPLNTEEYYDAYDQWQADREALSSK